MSNATLAPAAVQSVGPITLPVRGRAVDLQVRVTAPVSDSRLPIVLLSHGLGPSNHLSSLNGYAPLAQSLAADGFAVVQPTHLDSRTLSHLPDAVRATAWRSRTEDMRLVLDRLGELESAVPWLRGRLERERVAVVGHSMGGHTASLLLGARLVDPEDGSEVSLIEPRIRAGVLLGAPGRGGDVLTAYVAENYGFMSTMDFSHMTTPALVVAGDADTSEHLTSAGPDWHADPYRLAPGPKSLLTLYGAEHGFGGISGFDVAETTDENPVRAEATARLVGAYLRSALDPADAAWAEACAELVAVVDAQGRVESK